MKRRPAPSIQDHLNDLQIKCIGLITAEWAHLEATVSVAIWDYCAFDRERGLCITADLSSLSKIQILGALAKQRFSSDAAALEEISAIISDMTKLNTERNNIVHNLWSTNAMLGTMLSRRSTTRGSALKEKTISYTEDELVETYQKIGEAIARLLVFQEARGFSKRGRSA